ncbi:MlaD family protein [Candidatus Dependentiae bacterium]|nr:MlaD family protein [Candidatus Dependentiae bacterium]
MQLKTETTVGLFVLAALTLFFFMSARLGVINLNKKNYNKYYIYFSDVTGLAKKADVKIAGVKVGWIENIELCKENNVCVEIMVANNYSLNNDAQAFVKQDGILSNRFLEVAPGYSNLKLECGQCFKQVGKQPINFDDLALRLSEISTDIHKITTSMQRVLESNENSIKEMFEQIKNVLISIQENLPSIKTLNSIAQKIDDGKGLIGKMLNETEMYDDVKYTTRKVKSFLERLHDFSVVIDAHTESLFNNCGQNNFNNKGYFNLLLFPSNSYFLLGGATISQQGYASRKIIDKKFFDDNCHKIENEALVPRTCITKVTKDSWAGNLQFGKIFGNAIFRLGMFEGTLGLAFDYNIPFDQNRIWWLTSFEIFDFNGKKRFIRDSRPHLKWLNRFFITKNLYFDFGADDFISHNNKGFFVGAGLAFADEDIRNLFGARL